MRLAITEEQYTLLVEAGEEAACEVERLYFLNTGGQVAQEGPVAPVVDVAGLKFGGEGGGDCLVEPLTIKTMIERHGTKAGDSHVELPPVHKVIGLEMSPNQKRVYQIALQVLKQHGKPLARHALVQVVAALLKNENAKSASKHIGDLIRRGSLVVIE